MIFQRLHDLHTRLSNGQPVTQQDMILAGFTPETLATAAAGGVDWLTLLQYAFSFGMKLLPFILPLLLAAAKPPAATTTP